MEYELKEHDGVHVVKILSDKIVHANSDDLKSAMIDLIRQDGRKLLFDLSRVKFIDSRGLGMLISLLKSLGSDGAMALCSADKNVRNVFQVTRLNKVFHIFEDAETALQSMRSA